MHEGRRTEDLCYIVGVDVLVAFGSGGSVSPCGMRSKIADDLGPVLWCEVEWWVHFYRIHNDCYTEARSCTVDGVVDRPGTVHNSDI